MKNNNNGQPVTRKELWGLLMDFFEQIIAPYVDKRFDGVDERFDKLDERLDRHGRQLDNHEERIAKSEAPLP